MRVAWAPLFVLCLLAADSRTAADGQAPKPLVSATADLTIKTREVAEAKSAPQITTTMYLKGAWQRRETTYGFSSGAKPVTSGHIVIVRCDDHASLLLNPATKIFARSKIMPTGSVTVAVTSGYWLDSHGQQTGGAEVTTTVNTVDTGERRKVGSYTARHVIKTTTTVPGPGAGTPRSESVEDGWYIDLPSLGCTGEVMTGTMNIAIASSSNGVPDRVKMQFTGTGRQGFPIEETRRTSDDYGSSTSTLTLLEFSEATLTKSLFEVPKGYRPALRHLGGYADMTQPDTFLNRISAYVDDMGNYARSWFSF
jgi:hypothetical protein